MGTDPYHLGELIKNSVLVTSWRSVGGPGELSIDAGSSTLRVKNVASAQQAIHRLIETFEFVLNSRAAQDARKPPPTPQSFPMIVEHAGRPFEQTVSLYVVPSLLYVDDSHHDPQDADFDSLIRLITAIVEPDSWDSVGGPARIDAWPAGEALVVAATKHTHTEILALLKVLESFPTVGVSRLPSSAAPIGVQLQLGTPFVNMAAEDLITKLYPIHDLLPLETQPAFEVSPRATGLDQLCDRIVTLASPTNDNPICIRTFRNRATVLLAATQETHKKVSDALSNARRRKQTATTQEQRIALDQELFPPVYQDRDGYYPGSAVPVRVFLYGTCNADQQLARFAQFGEKIDSTQLIATDVTNDGLANVGQFTNLRQLICWSKGINYAGIAHLRNLQLTHLVLRGKQITDDCVEPLAAIKLKHPWMSRFDLSHTSITDKGLRRLVELNQRWLNVSHTDVTAAGVEQVRSEYPDAYIIFEN
jgi:hypothetical protein